ncbi:MAG: cysteine rich repeat-containing protein, partial [Pseudomonadota bacterium]
MKNVLITWSRAALTGVGAVALAACAQSGGESETVTEETSAAAGLPPEALSVGTFGKVCGADIADFCSEVLPGSGRLQSCLYAHQDLISDECFAANEQTGVMLETVFDGYYAFLEVCNADLN